MQHCGVPGQRRVTLDGQRFDPEDPDARLYATFFCRNCGQEHHPVILVEDGGVTQVLPRPIDETPLEDTEDGEQAGYLMPEPQGDPDYAIHRRLGGLPRGLARGRPEGRHAASRATGAVSRHGKLPSILAEQSGQPEVERGSCLASSASAPRARISRQARHARSTSSRAYRQRGGAPRRPYWCRALCAG